MAYVYMQLHSYVLLFLVLAVNSDQFGIVTHSYSSHPLLTHAWPYKDDTEMLWSVLCRPIEIKAMNILFSNLEKT